MMSLRPRISPLLAALVLAGCASSRQSSLEEPTLASLSAREPRLSADPGLKPTQEQVIAAYRQFIDVAVDVPQRAESLRRLGDLEMDSADRSAAQAAEAAAPDYKAARARYESFLKTYPKAPKTDRVLYQLARAQEQAGELETALKTLTQLVTEYPGTLHVGEAQFRRGEMLFATREYAQAEAAYDAVLRYERRGLPAEALPASPLVERALYMQGWSFFKLGRLDEALAAFFEVLDGKLAALPPVPREEVELQAIRQLTRADRELLEDTLRVISISLANLNGSATLARFIDGTAAPTPAATRLRTSYQFRVYQSLAELYLKQERVKDAADTLAAFVRQQPLHPQAPQLLARVVQVYGERGYPQQALAARREFVTRYGAGAQGEAFKRANPTGWRLAQPQVQAELAELARAAHAKSQQSRNGADADEGVRWYRALLAQFPDAENSASTRFLLGELLFENQRYTDAAAEYENVAYTGKASARSADAGYAALLAYAELDKQAATPEQRRALQKQAVESALRFAKANDADARSALVLVRAAEQLQDLGEGEQASGVAQQALNAKPDAAGRRAAWTVVAQQAFEASEAAQAEAAYAEVLALTPKNQPAHAAVAEKLAASIYKQGEQARESGENRSAVGHFERVAAVAALAAHSPIRASASFDAATELIALKDWPAAAAALETFRRQYAGHELQVAVAPKLALVYEAMGRYTAAAAEFEHVATQAGQTGASAQDALVVRSARWQIAELHLRAAAGAPPRSPLRSAAVKASERYLQLYPQPLEAAVEARWHLAELAKIDGPAARATAWLKEVQQADASAGAARTPRTRTLGGRAALALAEPVAQAYRSVPLVEPLARQLKLKKARFEDALKAYAGAADVGITEVTTAATFHSAALYQDFGRALLNAPRPKKLNKAELEQYTVMLEEQAFPFEEQAIALFEANARRAATGTYDQPVRDSFAELAKLKPGRWGKAERGEAALDGAKDTNAANDANRLNQQGIALRREGRFDEARRAYEAALTLDPKAADAQLNLAILHDLYLGDAARAAMLYQRCLELRPADAPTLNKWLAELKARKPAAATAAAADPAATSTGKEPS